MSTNCVFLVSDLESIRRNPSDLQSIMYRIMVDTTHLCSISYQNTPDCQSWTAHRVKILIQVGLQTESLHMFRYKEAFLDINQFIRDLFVILSSLNASHNNVVFPCLLSGSCDCMDFTRRMCDLNMIYDARMRGESIYFYLNICKWIMQILC